MTHGAAAPAIVKIGGGPPPVVAPGVAALQATVREAVAARTPLRVRGRGRWLDAGRPVRADRALDVGSHAGIVEYVPGDLTLTAAAGTPLAELQAAARAEGQWVPIEPWGGDAGTLGATLATATAGPTSGAVGLPRDVVLGVTVITGTGEVVRGGGRVVKNVAGFDLVRLMVGAWGTLGAIVEATVRLRALPERDETLAVAVPPPAGLDAWLARLRALPVAPLALELVSDGLAAALGLPPRAALLVRLAGNADTVTGQRRALAALGDAPDAPADVWTRLREAEPARAATLRYSAAPARLALPWGEALRAAAATPDAAAAIVHASVARGVVRLVVPAGDDAALAIALGERAPAGVTRLAERLPAALWPRLAPTAADDRLSRGVRRAFDPVHLLNPGVLGEPIA